MVLTPEDVAKRLRITGSAVRLLIKQGKLQATKYGSSWLIEESALAGIGDRPGRGRPRKIKQAS